MTNNNGYYHWLEELADRETHLKVISISYGETIRINGAETFRQAAACKASIGF